MQKSIGLFLSTILCLSLHASGGELSEGIEQEFKSEHQERTYEGNSDIYYFYDATINGIKGAGFAGIATMCTFGLYFPWAALKFGDLAFKRWMLSVSSAEQFNDKSRQDLEEETALRELTNRGAKAAISLATVFFIHYIVRNEKSVKRSLHVN